MFTGDRDSLWNSGGIFLLLIYKVYDFMVYKELEGKKKVA